MATPLLGLNKIARGDSTNWDVEEDANKDVIDTALGTQHTLAGTHDNIEPAVDSTGALGSPAKKYANLYVDSVPAPTISTNPATKAYVDSLLQGVSWQEAVIDNTVIAPPGTPILGDRYIVPVGATGAWVGQDTKFAQWNGSAWDLTPAVEPNAAWVTTSDSTWVYNGTAWVKFGSTVDHTNLINRGTNTHAQIDTHIADVANPHSTTLDQITPTTTKGDIIVEDGANVVRLPIGSDTQILIADSIQASGVKWGTPLPPAFIQGLAPNNSVANPNTDIDFSIGRALDSTNTVELLNNSVVTKALDGIWLPGSIQGGLFSGAIAPSTTYHCFIIRKDSDGSIDFGFDTSTVAANIPTGYTSYRRVGSIVTDASSVIIPYIIKELSGGKLELAIKTISSFSAPLSTAGIFVAIDSVPKDYGFNTKISLFYTSPLAATAYVINADQDIIPIANYVMFNVNNSNQTMTAFFRINNLNQVIVRTSITTQIALILSPLGWEDERIN